MLKLKKLSYCLPLSSTLIYFQVQQEKKGGRHCCWKHPIQMIYYSSRDVRLHKPLKKVQPDDTLQGYYRFNNKIEYYHNIQGVNVRLNREFKLHYSPTLTMMKATIKTRVMKSYMNFTLNLTSHIDHISQNKVTKVLIN